MTPEDASTELTDVIAAELAGMSEEDRTRAKQFVALAFANVAEFELRVRRLEEMREREASASSN